MSKIDTSTTSGKIAVMQAYERGEKIVYRIYRHGYDAVWLPLERKNDYQNPHWDWARLEYRLAAKKLEFPAPPEGEEWLNPKNLTPEVVEVDKGWRLLLKSEKQSDISQVQFYYDNSEQWLDGRCLCSGCLNTYAFRTKAPLPSPKKYVPMEEGDFPSLFWIRLSDSDISLLITVVTPEGVLGGDSSRVSRKLTFQDLMDGGALYSSDRKHWQLCRKEAHETASNHI